MTLTRQARLADGRLVHYRSQADFDILCRELDEGNLYLKHGISLKNGACVFDVGANIGFFLLYLNNLIDEGRVFAFEPIPDVFEVLERNSADHNRLELQLFPYGLSEQAGEAVFSYYPRTSVASTMCPDRSDDFKRNSRRFVMEEMKSRGGLLNLLISVTPEFFWWPVTESVRRFYQATTQVRCQLRTLSEVIDDHQVRCIDLLKIDVEGAEHQVLDGLRDEHWELVQQLVVEVHRGQESTARIQSQLQDRGFSTFAEQLMPGVEHLHVVYARRQGAAELSMSSEPVMGGIRSKGRSWQ